MSSSAVETRRVDTEQALFRLCTDITLGVPDWTNFCAALDLLPNRASKRRDYDTLISLRNTQARFCEQLMTIKEQLFEAASEFDLQEAKQMLR